MKIRLVRAKWFHPDGRTGRQTWRSSDMTKLIDAFRNFAKAPKNRYAGNHSIVSYVRELCGKTWTPHPKEVPAVVTELLSQATSWIVNLNADKISLYWDYAV
jgi:hypothetical protein